MKHVAKVLLAVLLALFLFSAGVHSYVAYGRSHSSQIDAYADVTSVQQAQNVFSSITWAYASELSCLRELPMCLPEWPDDRPLLGEPFPSRGSQFYVLSLHPGEPTEHRRDGIPSELNLVATYAVVAVPNDALPGANRAFCADSRGLICYTPDGSIPNVENGQCRESPGAPPPRPLNRLGIWLGFVEPGACYIAQ